MPAFLTTILSILGLIAGDLPQIEAAIGGFWTFVTTEIAKLFGQAAASSTLTGLVTQAQAEVQIHDADSGAAATTWVKSQFATVDALLTAYPGLAQSLAVRDSLVKGGVTHAVAAKITEAAHSNTRVAAPAYQAQIASLASPAQP